MAPDQPRPAITFPNLRRKFGNVATSRHRSPEFPGIRESGLREAKILTALIRLQLRSEFGPAQFGDDCDQSSNRDTYLHDLLQRLAHDPQPGPEMLRAWLPDRWRPPTNRESAACHYRFRAPPSFRTLLPASR
jgi:hypothetical protein